MIKKIIIWIMIKRIEIVLRKMYEDYLLVITPDEIRVYIKGKVWWSIYGGNADGTLQLEDYYCFFNMLTSYKNKQK